MDVTMDVAESFIFTLNKEVIFDPNKHCLIGQDGTVVELSENNSRFLLLLLNGETDKQSLINNVWSEQRGAVSESSYYGQIYLLRKALSQTGLAHSLIKTIPRKGVKFIGKVTKSAFLEDSVVLHENESLPNQRDSAILSDENDRLSLSYGNQATSLPSEGQDKEWYHSRSWNIFVSVLAMLAVCWLTTLVYIFIYFWKSN